MDLCKVLESWTFFDAWYSKLTKTSKGKIGMKRLKNLFLKEIFQIEDDPTWWFPGEITIKFTKDFREKMKNITQEFNLPKFNYERFHMDKEDVQVLSFVDIWEMKRAGLR